MHPAGEGPDLIHILFYALSVLGGLAATAVGVIWKNHLRHINAAWVRIEKRLDDITERNREDHEKFFDRIGKLEIDVGVLKNRK